MAIVRAPRPARDFTLLSNAMLRDERLSYRARGILAAILSHADGWHTTADTLAASGPEGRDAVRTALAELRAAGYVISRRTQDEKGRWLTNTYVYDTPQDEADDDTTADPVDNSPSPKSGFQASVHQASVPQALKEEDQEEDQEEGGRSVPTSPAAPPVDNPPQPQRDERTNRERCLRHQLDETPPKCGDCADARKAEAAATAARLAAATAEARDATRTQARQRAEEARLRLEDIRRCGMCDDQGHRGRAICHHDPDQVARDAARAAEVRALLVGSGRPDPDDAPA